jgi:hypothetical protein
MMLQDLGRIRRFYQDPDPVIRVESLRRELRCGDECKCTCDFCFDAECAQCYREQCEDLNCKNCASQAKRGVAGRLRVSDN